MAKGTPAKEGRNKELVLLKLSGKTFRELAKKYKMSQTGVKTIYYRDLDKYKHFFGKTIDKKQKQA